MGFSLGPVGLGERLFIYMATKKSPLSQVRSTAGRLGGLTLSSTRDPKEYTAPARKGFLARFWPDDPTLSQEEAERRAKAALRLHMSRLAYLSVKARSGGKTPHSDEEDEMKGGLLT